MLLNVIDQTERHVLKGEEVPSNEKLISFFEPHSDIIKKDRRNPYYGHKIYLTAGKNGLILDCHMPRGYPNDSTLVGELIYRQKEVLEKTPRQMAWDGGFRPGPMHMERLGRLQTVRLVQRGCLQPPGLGQLTIGTTSAGLH